MAQTETENTMRPEDKPPFLAMPARVFVRAVRDFESGLAEDGVFELSEGEATDLVIRREEIAYLKGLRAAAQILGHEVEAIARSIAAPSPETKDET